MGTGIYITLNYYADVFRQLVVYPKFADGNFEWEVTDTMFNSIINGCDLPGFTRTSVNRNLGEPDRMVITPWYKCDGSSWPEHMWYDKDPLTMEWTPTRDRVGDDTDPFSLSYNNLFSPWSNPSSYSSLTGGATNYSVWLYNQNGNNISIQVKTTESSSLGLPPSKPHFGWNPGDFLNEYGWIYLAWGADWWDGESIEPDYEWSELQRKIGDGSWVTLYSGPNRVWSDGSITYDPNGSTPVYFRVRIRDSQGLWSVLSDLFSTKMIPCSPFFDKSGSGNTSEKMPSMYLLEQNYPNPFNPTTTISYSVQKDGLVTLKVFDILGKEVANLVNNRMTAGSYSVEFNAANLPSGIYVYKLTSGNFTESKKLILLK